MKLIAILLLVLVVAPLASASYLGDQGGNDRIGRVEGEGPEFWDVAFQVDLEGLAVGGTPPILIGDDAYILLSARNGGIGFESSGSTILWNVDLQTGQKSVLHDFGPNPVVGGTASDGESIFFVTAGAIQIVNLAEREAKPPVSIEEPADNSFSLRGSVCPPGVIVGEEYWVACAMVPGWAIHRVNIKTGVLVDTIRDADVALANPIPLAEQTAEVHTLVGSATHVALAISRGGDNQAMAVHFFRHDGAPDGLRSYALPAYQNAIDLDPRLRLSEVDSAIDIAYAEPYWVIQIPGHAELYSKEENRVIWSLAWPTDSTETAFVTPGLATMLDSTLYFSVLEGGPRYVAAVGFGDGRILWPETEAHRFSRASLGTGAMLGFGDQVLATASNAIYIFTAETGTLDASIGSGKLLGGPYLVALDANRAAVLGVAGQLVPGAPGGDLVRLTLFGDMAPAIQLNAEINGDMLVGQQMNLDLSRTRPGISAPDVDYQIDWGDNSEFAIIPNASHVYESAGEYILRVTATNSAGQEATLIRTLNVETPQSPPTFLEDRFAAENQEVTFFILGLAVTLLAAAFAAARLGRKRHRLRRELEAVDTEAENHRQNPLALHRAMNERAEHAKTLLVAARLDEAQYAVLKGHIDAVAAGGRLESIEQDFPFLPMSLGSTLQGMLDDGRISKWERQTFLAALDADDVLTAGQKKKISGRIDSWFAEDA